MNFSLHVNGIGNAFLREFGCECPRCRSGSPLANTSLSVIGREKGSIAWHGLVDTGMGVADSLCANLPPREARLDLIMFTHWHPDHTLELNRICETLRHTRRRRGEKFHRIPAWMRAGTAKWIKNNYSYEWHRCLAPFPSAEGELPGRVLDRISLEAGDLRVTPVTVSHYSADLDAEDFRKKTYCSASFVVETEGKKAVLLWDLDNRNDWIADPKSDEEKEARKFLSSADYLFIDCFCWRTEEVLGINTGHIAFSTARKYISALSPKLTCLVHMSGHEDEPGREGWGWDDRRWESEARRVWTEESLPGSVRVPATGEEFNM